MKRRAGLAWKTAWNGPSVYGDAARRVPTGHAAIDGMIGGGLIQGRLHEIFAASRGDAGSAAGFVAMLACQRGGPVLWVRDSNVRQAQGRLCAAGLAEIGLDPARMLSCIATDRIEALRAANEGARCPQIASVVLELWCKLPELDLTTTRRLALAAEKSGATVLLLRVDAEPVPSAATTRWSVASAPSTPLPGNAPGFPAFDLSLLRQRGRAGEGAWRVVWDRDHGRFDDSAAISGAARPASLVRPFAPDQRRAA